MEYPALRAYMAAIADLKNINIPFFKSKSMQIYLNRRGVPYMSVGGFGAVFRFKDKNGKQYALKCFTRFVPGRAERYRALHDTLQVTRFPFMVDFQYVEEGIKVGKNSYPVVVMEWGSGRSLDLAIDDAFEEGKTLDAAPKLAGNLFNIVKTLQEWRMAHGDLQEGNLLIGQDGQIGLIDYDGMFVPALEGEAANEVGLADYQHPLRNNDHFSHTLDDFSLLTILFQLSILTPKLWKTHHDDRRLLLKQADHADPKKSTLIKRGISSKKPHVKELAKLLRDACAKNPLEIDAIEAIESSQAIMDWLEFTESVAADSNFTSIISRVVSLTDDQVENFEAVEEQELLKEDHTQFAVPETPEAEENDGAWGVSDSIKKGLIDIFFEESEAGDTSNQAQGTNAFTRLKTGFMNLMFEEEPGESENTRGTPTGSRRGGASTPPEEDSPPAPVSPTTPPTNPPPTTPPAGKTGNENASGAGSPAGDGKTAPKPDWMKRRRRK